MKTQNVCCSQYFWLRLYTHTQTHMTHAECPVVGTVLWAHVSCWVRLFQISGLFLGEQLQWVGCQGSRVGLRGYPCSLWTLFHVLTVQAASRPDGLANTGTYLYIVTHTHSHTHTTHASIHQLRPISFIPFFIRLFKCQQ